MSAGDLAFLPFIGCLLAQFSHFAREHIFGQGEQDSRVLDIHLSFDYLWYDRNRAYDLQDHLRTFGRIVLRILHQQLGLEANKVMLVTLQECFQVRGVVTFSKAVWVFSLGQQYDAHINTLLEHHIYTAQRSFNACFVAIVEQYDILRKAVNEAYLVNGQCRTT